jgi:hypothetical protein
MVTPEGVKPFLATGYRTMDARTNFFYGVTGIFAAHGFADNQFHSSRP